MLCYLKYRKNYILLFFQDPIILVRECSLFLPLWDLWTFCFWNVTYPVQRTTSGIHLEWPFGGFVTSSHKCSILAVFHALFYKTKSAWACHWINGITQSINKEFVNTFRDFERRILKYKRAEVVSSHVGLVSHELCPRSTLELVITSFETNITDFLIGLIAHAKECFILQLLWLDNFNRLCRDQSPTLFAIKIVFWSVW